jgi:hypothetical protein
MLIRYQVLPATAVPAHVARQLPPVTVVTAYTCVFADRVVFLVAAVLGEMRSETPSHFVDLVDAPRASAGLATDATADSIAADKIAVTMTRNDIPFARRVAPCML